MDKTLSRDIGKLQNGIGGFYRTKGFKIRMAICILLVALIIAGIFVGVYFSTRFNGRVILLCKLSGAYNHFYQYNPELLSELGMTKDEFESKASLEVICGTTTEWYEQLRRLGISGIDYESAASIKPTKCYIILTNNNGEIVYQGTDVLSLATNLKSLGF